MLARTGCVIPTAVTSTVRFSILYLSDYSAKIKCVTFDENMHFKFNEPLKHEGEYYALPSLYADSVITKPVSARKILVKCMLHPSCAVYADETNSIYIKDDGDEDICTLEKTIEYCENTILHSEIMTASAELVLEKDSPSAADVILPKVCVHSVKCNCIDEKIKIDAKLSLYALYECAAEEAADNTSQTYASVASQADLICEIPGVDIKESQHCSANIDICGIESSCSFDSYGESRIITFELKYTVTAFIWECKTHALSEDAFSTKFSCTPILKKLSIDKFLMPVDTHCTVSETVYTDIGGLNDISACFARIDAVSTENVEGNFFASAKCTVEVLGINSSGELTGIDVPVIFHVPVGDSKAEASQARVILSVTSCDASIKDGALNLNADFCITGCYTSKSTVQAVSELDISKDEAIEKNKSEIVVCYPVKDDSLWKVAKRYKVNPQEISLANNLENDDINGIKMIIIP